MKRLVWIPLLVASAASAQQIAPTNTTAAPGASSSRAVGVQGVTGGIPIPISGSISTSGAADGVSAGAPTTFSANAVCTGQLLLAGEQGAGFQLNAGTLAATLVPQYSLEASGSNWTTTQFIDQNGAKTPSLIVTNPNALFQQGIVLVTGARRAQVCTTAYTSGSATGLATAAFVQGGAAASGGGGGSSDVAIHDNGTPSQHLAVDGTGKIGVNNFPATQPISAAALPLPAGASTEATLALIKAKTDNLDVALSTRTKPADTQTVSGTVTANAGSGTFTVGGTVTANVGTTNGLALDASVTGLHVGQGSTTSGQNGDLVQGAVTTGAPTYTTAQTSPLSLTTAGALRTDASATTQPVSGSVSVSNFPGTQPVSGTVTSNQGGAPWTQRIQDGAGSTLATVTAGNAVKVDGSAVTQPVSGTVTANAGSGTFTVAGTVTANQGGTWTVQPGNTANTTAWKVDNSAVTQPVSGTVTTTPPANASTNVTQFGGTNVSTGTGAGGAGIPRVTISNDSSLAANQSVNVAQVNGVGTTTGAGTSTTGTQRVAVATSDGSQLATANTGRLQVDVISGGGSNASVGSTYTTTPTSAALAGLAGQNGTMVPAKATPDGSMQVALSPSSPIQVTQIVVGQPGKQTITSVQTQSLKFQLQDEKGHVAPVKGPMQPATVSDQAMVVAQSPIPAPICSSVAAISQTANTRLIVGIPGKRIFVCSMLLVSATAQSVALTEGTGATCGTAALALIGSTTVANGPSLAANGGWSQTAASPFMVSQVLGDDLCLLQSGSGNVSGSITFTQF